MKRGLYAIFEGIDGSGKTSTMLMVAEELEGKLSEVLPTVPPIRNTHHPGHTPLGAHLRQLIRHPKDIGEDIEIDELSRQFLYMTDTTSFIKSFLEPALEAKEIVFADRSSYISGLAFGCVDGVPAKEIIRLYSVVVPPRADRLYIFQCPVEMARQRISVDERRKDRYDKLPEEFHQRVSDVYDNIATGSPERIMLLSRCVALENIVYVDSSAPQEEVVNIIVADLMRLLSERERFKI